MFHSAIKKRVTLFSIFSLLVTILTAQVAFQETSFSNAQFIIQEEKLPYIIYFYGNWCPSCQLMEETTFKDAKVKKQIESNYVVFKVNADSERGKEWMGLYGITSVPTTLFYTKENYLLNKLVSPITASDFLNITADLGKLPTNIVLNDFKKNLSNKNSKNKVLTTTKKRVNSSPKKSDTPNLNATIGAINVEIEHLKRLIGSSKENISSKVFSTNNSVSLTNNQHLTAKESINTSIITPTAKTITSQIEACKSLLTNHKNIQKLIDILEDYKLALLPQNNHQIETKEVLVPAEYKPAVQKVNTTVLTNYQKLYQYNQQIISYLKLAPPIKKGNQYIVQIGKYQNIRNAERLVQKIQDKYDYPIKIHIQKKGDLPVQVVYLGEFKTKSEAIAANENLKWINRKGVVKQF